MAGDGNPFEKRARKLKAAQLVMIAERLGVSAAELEGEEAKARLLDELARVRGHEVGASLETWRRVWRELRAAEVAAEHPGYARAVGAEAPYSTVPGRNPFAA